MNKTLKIVLPHIVVLAIVFFLLYFGVFQAMKDTNNNGEFGFPELGTYDWGNIMSILIPWFIVLFVALEIPLLTVQLLWRVCKKYLKHRNKKVQDIKNTL